MGEKWGAGGRIRLLGYGGIEKLLQCIYQRHLPKAPRHRARLSSSTSFTSSPVVHM